MAFLPILSDGRARRNASDLRLYVSKTGRNLDRSRLTFVLSVALIDRLRWHSGERFAIAMGVDEDLGAFQISRITKLNTGTKLHANSNGRGFRLSVSLPPDVHGDQVAAFLDGRELPANLTSSAQKGVLSARFADGLPMLSAKKRRGSECRAEHSPTHPAHFAS
ncbi:hypothetical protein [Rhodomicrobium lacus]|uniref:hypothetical protein n=1 Tax=Rhodomicrobium lacus TaxID=2498452 RepID=UPI000F8D293B|nr:hypothetical protein [Rhodomicrobium lacus]